MENLLLLLPIGVLAGGFQLLFQAWHVYCGELKIVARSKLAQAISSLFASLGSGLAEAGALGLIASYIAGFWVAISVLIRGHWQLVQTMFQSGVTELKRAFVENRRAPTPPTSATCWASILTAAA